jgi:peptide/nickel transport system permease protein
MQIALPNQAIKRPFNAVMFQFRRSPLAFIPMIIMAIFLVIAVFAPWIAPHDPRVGDLDDAFRPPFWMAEGQLTTPLGTDRFGRDIFSRIILGARVSLIAAASVILIAGTVGTVVGILAGYLEGMADMILMRVVDLMLSIPSIMLALVLAVIFQPGLFNVIVVVSLIIWSRFARVIRGEVLAIKRMDFISRARVAGASNLRIMLRHVFPSVVNTLIVVATFQIGYVILLESSLSYLGVGIAPPTPAWGIMVSDGRNYLGSAWWLSMFPGLAILIIVMAVNLMGDWLRDRLDPRLRQL